MMQVTGLGYHGFVVCSVNFLPRYLHRSLSFSSFFLCVNFCQSEAMVCGGCVAVIVCLRCLGALSSPPLTPIVSHSVSVGSLGRGAVQWRA